MTMPLPNRLPPQPVPYEQEPGLRTNTSLVGEFTLPNGEIAEVGFRVHAPAEKIGGIKAFTLDFALDSFPEQPREKGVPMPSVTLPENVFFDIQPVNVFNGNSCRVVREAVFSIDEAIRVASSRDALLLRAVALRSEYFIDLLLHIDATGDADSFDGTANGVDIIDRLNIVLAEADVSPGPVPGAVTPKLLAISALKNRIKNGSTTSLQKAELKGTILSIFNPTMLHGWVKSNYPATP